MQYSFQLYSARNFIPWDKVFDSIQKLGYSQVEGYGDVYESPEQTRQLLDKTNLTMPSGHFALDELENDLDATLKKANLLGCKHVFCPYLLEDQRPEDKAGWQLAVFVLVGTPTTLNSLPVLMVQYRCR